MQNTFYFTNSNCLPEPHSHTHHIRMGCNGLAEERSIAFLVLYYKLIDRWAFEIMFLGFYTLPKPSHTFFYPWNSYIHTCNTLEQ